jgi:hypothetical protein
MSFKYKPKIVLKDLRFKELFELYNSYFHTKELRYYFQNSVEENRNCQLCNSLIPLGNQIYGIPIGFRQIENELEVDIHGTYCSLYCSYNHYRNIKEDSSRRKCIKFLDSEQLYRCLFYKFFKKFVITQEDKEINLQEKYVRFRKVYNIDA